MKNKTIIVSFGITAVIILGFMLTLSCGPRYGYHHMYDYNDYDGMMGRGYGYGGGMMGPGYGYGGRMMGPGYGYDGMMGRGYGRYDALGFMSSELDLTEDQEKKIYKLAARYREKYFDTRGNIQEIEKLEKQHRKDIEKILTPEQRIIFERYQRGFDRYGWFGGCPYH